MPLRVTCIDISAGEVFGQPHDQVVIHGHVPSLTERFPAPARAPAIRNTATLCVQPLSGTVFVEQPGGDAQFRDTPVAGQLPRRVHEQAGNTSPAEWPGDGEL